MYNHFLTKLNLPSLWFKHISNDEKLEIYIVRATTISPMKYCKSYFKSRFTYSGAINIFIWNDDHNEI